MAFTFAPRFSLRLLLLFAGLFASALVAAGGPVRVGGSEYPVSTFTEDGKFVGLDFDIVDAVLREAGVAPPERVIAPWPRVTYMLDRGDLEMVVPMVYSRERADKYLLTPSIRSRYNIVLMKRTRARKIESVTDLTGLTVGKCLGYAYQEELEEAFAKGKIKAESCLDNEMGIKMLYGERMDALVIGEDAAVYLLNKLHLENDFVIAAYRSEKASHVGINRNNSELYAKFMDGLERANRKGTIEKVIRAWARKYSVGSSAAPVAKGPKAASGGRRVTGP